MSRRSSLAARIAVRSAAIFTAISVLVFVAVWASLTSVASSSITVVPENGASSAPEVVEAVFRLTNQAKTMTMTVTGSALALITALGTFLTYRAARASLRRVSDITQHTRRITASTLDERLALRGPDDEIKDLADTIDDTLSQLSDAFAQQERFAANASHELRTPLAVVRTSLESIGGRIAHDEDVDRSLRNVTRMDETIDALLLLAQTRRLPEDRRYPVDVAGVVRILADDLAPAFAARGVSFEVRADQVAIVDGDQTLLTQAVHNLMRNAAQYAPADGHATFEVTASPTAVTARFANDGCAYTDEEVAQLLEPFSRGAQTRAGDVTGHGLGLSIVVSIARQHGGTFELEPRQEGGLVGTLRLPPATEEAGDATPGLRSAQPTQAIT